MLLGELNIYLLVFPSFKCRYVETSCPLGSLTGNTATDELDLGIKSRLLSCALLFGLRCKLNKLHCSRLFLWMK